MKLISIKTKSVLAALLIMAVSLGIYANSLGNSFIGDDLGVIRHCSFIRSWQNFPDLFTLKYFSLSGESTYRPVVTFFYMLDYSLWQRNPFGYHLTNIILHALNGVLLYLLILRLFPKRTGLALSCALLFVSHPITTEAVNAPSFREDLLTLNFSLLSFLAYVKISPQKPCKPTYFLLSLGFLFLALFSKELAFSLPFVFLLSDICFSKEWLKTLKQKLPLYLSFILGLSLFILIRFVIFPSQGKPSLLSTSLYTRLLTQTKIIVFYIKLLLFPLNLSPGYPYSPVDSFGEPAVIFSIILLLVILVFSIISFYRNRSFLFGMGWFFLFLLPVSNIIPIFDPVTERFLYVPLIGFCLVAGLIGENIFHRFPAKIKYILPAFLIILLGLYSYRTIERNKDWKTPLTLWSKAVQVFPGNARSHNNLGNAYSDLGKDKEALISYKKALETMCKAKQKRLLGGSRIYNNLGVSYYNIGETNKAITYYKKALEIDPDYADTYNNLGVAYYSTGAKEETKDLLKKAIKIKPDFAKPYNNLGILYKDLGQTDEAITCYKKALELDPDYTTPLNGLSLIYYNTNRNEEAIILLKKILKINPGNKKAHMLLAMIYYKTKQYDLAVKYCDKAIMLGFKVEKDFLKSLLPYRKH